MPESLPSLELLVAEARLEREMVLRHADAVDTKGGVLLGAAAALTALGSGSPWREAALPASLLAACVAIAVLWPRDFRARQLRATRDAYLTSDPRFTELMLLDSTIDLVDQARQALDVKVRRLKASALLLVLAGALLVAGTLARSIGG